MFCIKKTAYERPSDVSAEDFDFICSNETARWIYSSYYLNLFIKIFGVQAATIAKQTSKVPMNTDRNCVGPGQVYEIGGIGTGSIPDPGSLRMWRGLRRNWTSSWREGNDFRPRLHYLCSTTADPSR